MKMTVHPRLLFSVLVVLAMTLAGCKPGEEAAGLPGARHDGEAASFERGPHRGRLLRDGPFALELQIFEEGVPPEFHVYLSRDGKPLPPTGVTVSVELTRLDGEVDRFAFAPEGDYLKGSGVVHEPHSFSVQVIAQEGATNHRWTYDSFEGRTTIAAATAAAAGVQTETAGPATLKDTLVLTGRLVPNSEQVREVTARFPGAVREVARSVGDSVRAGERLATIESNESLETYAVTAPISGVITERHANPGENAAGEPLFIIADYSTLWAELNLFPRDLARVKAGQKVLLKSVDGELTGEGQVVRIAPAPADQASAVGSIYTARVALANADRRWTPGLFLEGAVQIGETRVPLAVKRSGLQSFRDFTVVFEQVGETYEARMLELGRQDDAVIEVLGGLKPGVKYVTGNSYLIKADIDKSGASHDH
jgi:membrane fusion protein, heavy metal efflux system